MTRYELRADEGAVTVNIAADIKRLDIAGGLLPVAFNLSFGGILSACKKRTRAIFLQTENAADGRRLAELQNFLAAEHFCKSRLAPRLSRGWITVQL